MPKPKISDRLTPGEVIEKYPSLKKINWTVESIATAVRMGLLRGTFNASQRQTFIEEDSIFTLIDFRNGVIDAQKLQL